MRDAFLKRYKLTLYYYKGVKRQKRSGKVYKEVAKGGILSIII